MRQKKERKAVLQINDPHIDWDSSVSHYFFNPRHPQAQELKELARSLPFFPGHIYLFTSGGGKICLLSKQAFLHSAQAVNKNLQTQTQDKWLITLPLFHVAGLSILARSFCGGYTYKKNLQPWQADSFQSLLKKSRASLCSLVPAQVYDLVQAEIKPPKTLRAVVVGGGALSPWIYKQARVLSWPLLNSYGLTEACSQVACASLESLNKKAFPQMKLLDHILIQKTAKGLKIKSKSLLTACFDRQSGQICDPKDRKGWLELPDRCRLKGKFLSVRGRKDEEVKILGESVDLQKLSFLVEELSRSLPGKYYLFAAPHARKGAELCLISNSFQVAPALALIKKFNTKVLPFEKIKGLYLAPTINKNALFKVRQKELLQEIGYNS